MKPIVVVSASGEVREELPFHLRDYLKYDDLFRYGMTPQFVSRFESIVVLNDLGESDLARIFVEPEASIFRTSRAYFQRFGIDLQITRGALIAIAWDAARQKRLGARALARDLPPRHRRSRVRSRRRRHARHHRRRSHGQADHRRPRAGNPSASMIRTAFVLIIAGVRRRGCRSIRRFVDNRAAPGGNGTRERPFTTHRAWRPERQRSSTSRNPTSPTTRASRLKKGQMLIGSAFGLDARSRRSCTSTPESRAFRRCRDRGRPSAERSSRAATTSSPAARCSRRA